MKSMRKIYSIIALALFAIIVSCTDDELDPLQFKKVSKGTLLALRGDYLDAIYFDGTSGASFVPLITDGTDVFSFEGEFLSDNPSALESIDVYAEDKDEKRTLLKNFKASEFKTGENGRPVITVSFTLAEILPKIGIPATFPLPAATVKSLLKDYAAGINIVTDINLTDGTKVLADDMVASGLYQSDQFYPAMRLPFDVVEYCPYDEAEWEGDYKGLEIGSDDTVGPYTVTFIKTAANTFEVAGLFEDMDNKITVVFSPSTSPYDQDLGNVTATVDGEPFKATKGAYEQCTGTINFTVVYSSGDDEYKFTLQLSKI